MTLGSEERQLKVALHIDWKEEAAQQGEQPVLTYCVPLAETTGRMLCEVPGGVQWRPAQEMDLPCLRYGAAETADGRVVALAADCKYGFRLAGGDLAVTLVNTAYNPDPYPERGIQDVTLFLTAAPADAARLSTWADGCMKPLQYVTNNAHPGTLPTTASLLETEGDTVVFTGVAQREGRLAVRMHEVAGKTCPVTVTLPDAVETAAATDLFGQPLEIPVTVSGCRVSFTLPPYTMAELRL